MHLKEITIRDEAGLHARPAASIVKLANKFTSNIIIEFGEKVANAKSIMALMKLGVKGNTAVIIKAEGDDEQEAIDIISTAINNNFK